MTEAQLRAFVAVAETGSFAEAARQLHMTQSGVSRAVATLETEAVKIGIRQVIHRRRRFYRRLQQDKTLKLPGF